MPHLVCQKHTAHWVVQEDLCVYILKNKASERNSVHRKQHRKHLTCKQPVIIIPIIYCRYTLPLLLD